MENEPSYSAYEVAQIAAKLVAEGGLELSLDSTYTRAAAAAVVLLDACGDELRWQRYIRDCRQETARQQAALAKQQAKLLRENPSGYLSWLSGLLQITGQRSETDGSPLFRRWIDFETTARKSREAIDGANVSLGPGFLEAEATYRKRGFSVEEVLHFGLRYKQWHTEHGIPGFRRAAGLKSAEVRKKKRECP